MITSLQNPRIQQIRALMGSRPRERREAGAFVVEGVRLAEEAYTAGWETELVLVSENLSPRGQALAEKYSQRGVVVEQVASQILQSISDTETSQGILTVVRIQTLPYPTPLNFIVIADAVRDPGNLGTLFRTAAAAGVQALICAPGTVDPTSPKVVRAGMGAQFRLPFRSMSWDEIGSLIKNPPDGAPLRLYVAEAEEGQIYWRADLRSPTALLVGGEAEGASAEGRQMADGFIRIPMPGKSESLNAAVAAAILLFEVVRQRHYKS